MNAVPLVVMTIMKLFFLQLHNYNFSPVKNRNVNMFSGGLR